MATLGLIDDGLFQVADEEVALGGDVVGFGPDIDSHWLHHHVVLAARADSVGDEPQIARFALDPDAVAGGVGPAVILDDVFFEGVAAGSVGRAFVAEVNPGASIPADDVLDKGIIRILMAE
jgi:hypothetical protein